MRRRYERETQLINALINHVIITFFILSAAVQNFRAGFHGACMPFWLVLIVVSLVNVTT